MANTARRIQFFVMVLRGFAFAMPFSLLCEKIHFLTQIIPWPRRGVNDSPRNEREPAKIFMEADDYARPAGDSFNPLSPLKSTCRRPFPQRPR